MRQRLLLLCLVVTLAALPAPAAPPATAPAPSSVALSRHDRIVGLTHFYAAAKQHFAWFEKVPDLDWDRAYRDFLPLVEREQSTLDYYRTLQRFAALLQDGHTQVNLPPDVEATLDRLPIRIELVENRWLVTERSPTPEILAQDVPPGTEVLTIDGLATGEYFGQRILPYVAAGNPISKYHSAARARSFPRDSTVSVELRSPDGTTEKRVLRANRKSVRWTDELRKEYLPPASRLPPFSSSTLVGGTLYVRYAACNDACLGAFVALVDALDSAAPPPAMILDLRDNGGGSTPSRAVRHLIARPVPGMRFRSRLTVSYFEAQTQGMPEPAKAAYLKSRRMSDKVSPGWLDLTNNEGLTPATRHYDGPLVILTDTATASAAEDMIVLLRARPNTTIVGRPTFGSTGQPLFLDLPGGGSARVCTAQCRYPDGKDFVGPGIQPDILIPRTIRSVTEGKDDIFEAALARLRGRFPATTPAAAAR